MNEFVLSNEELVALLKLTDVLGEIGQQGDLTQLGAAALANGSLVSKALAVRDAADREAPTDQAELIALTLAEPSDFATLQINTPGGGSPAIHFSHVHSNGNHNTVVNWLDEVGSHHVANYLNADLRACIVEYALKHCHLRKLPVTASSAELALQEIPMVEQSVIVLSQHDFAGEGEMSGALSWLYRRGQAWLARVRDDRVAFVPAGRSEILFAINHLPGFE